MDMEIYALSDDASPFMFNLVSTFPKVETTKKIEDI